MNRIDSFQEEYRFLSNFYSSPIWYPGIKYPTAEHAYQAQKCQTLDDRKAIALLETPGQAKRHGKTVVLRENWEQMKLGVMLDVVRAKFYQNAELHQKLLDTGDAILVEGNTWGDTFWGMVDNQGQNWLGRILMLVRSDLYRMERLRARG